MHVSEICWIFSSLTPSILSPQLHYYLCLSLHLLHHSTNSGKKKKKKEGWAYLPKKNPTTKTISNTDDTIIIFQTIRSTNTSNCHYSLTPTINKLKKKSKPKKKKKTFEFKLEIRTRGEKKEQGYIFCWVVFWVFQVGEEKRTTERD